MEKTLTEQEVKDLVEKASTGDRAAINDLLKLYISDMYFVTRLYVKDRDQARTTEQTALRNALKRLGESKRSERFEDWLYTIVQSEALESVLPVSVESSDDVSYTGADEFATIIDEYNDEECRVRILHILDALPDNERVASALRFYDHYSLDEIAQKMFISKDEVKALLTSAKENINDSEADLGSFLALVNRIHPDTNETAALELGEKERDLEASFDEEDSVEIGFDTSATSQIELPEAGTPVVPMENEPLPNVMPTEAKHPEAPAPQQPVVEHGVGKEEVAAGAAVAAAGAAAASATTQAKAETQTQEQASKQTTKQPKEKKKNNLLRILLILLLLLALVAGAYWFLFMRDSGGSRPEPTPSATPVITPSETVEPTQEPEPTATVEPEPTPTADPNGDGTYVIGKAVVNVDDLRVRSGASTSDAQVGTATKGYTYDVYQIKEAGGYTWYKISSDDEWIASDGSWVSYTAD